MDLLEDNKEDILPTKRTNPSSALEEETRKKQSVSDSETDDTTTDKK